MLNVLDNGSEYFNFRIVEQPDGSQFIDDRIVTPMDMLTPTQQVEYMEIYNELGYMERMREKDRKKQMQSQQRTYSGLIYKVACMCNLL